MFEYFWYMDWLYYKKKDLWLVLIQKMLFEMDQYSFPVIQLMISPQYHLVTAIGVYLTIFTGQPSRSFIVPHSVPDALKIMKVNIRFHTTRFAMCLYVKLQSETRYSLETNNGIT